MSGVKTRVRELAGWGLDEDEYRPAMYRGNPEEARALVVRRTPFEDRSALVEWSDSRLGARLKEQTSRGDLCREMTGLDWFLGVVDLRFLLAFQRRLVFDPEERQLPVPENNDWDGLMDLCFGETKPVVCDAVRTNSSVLLRSANPNLQFRVKDDSSNPVAIHSGSPFLEIGEYSGRWFLRDGYHRAFRCLRASVFHLPALIVRARTLEELGAARPWFFLEKTLFSTRPPRVPDFLDDELVIQYERSPLIKTLRLTFEETYSLQGEEL